MKKVSEKRVANESMDAWAMNASIVQSCVAPPEEVNLFAVCFSVVMCNEKKSRVIDLSSLLLTVNKKRWTSCSPFLNAIK